MFNLIRNKKVNIIVVSITIFSMVALYAFVPLAEAASLVDAKDTISDSNPGQTAVTHTITFTTGVALEADDYINVTFPAPFGNVTAGGNITCPGGMTASAATTEIARCTSDAGTVAGAKEITVVLDNPAGEGSQTINIASIDHTDLSENEGADVMVAIIYEVAVYATVASTLTFEINPLLVGVDVNGSATTIESATTSLTFGTLDAGDNEIMGQQLKVITNANDGFVVTVEQSGDLSNGGGGDIDPFDEGTPAAPKAWEIPVAVLDSDNTYGHMGITSEDEDLVSAADTFGEDLYQGFTGTTPIAVMVHDGPADGSTAHKGLTQVAYQIEINSLQEAGDYTNTLTYICTPQY